LSEDAALCEQLRAEPALIPRFIEELLRLASPVQGQFRKTTRDVVLADVEIPEGSLLHVRLASANRDETTFGPMSDAVDLAANRRQQHMSFGAGLHFCVGAMLSRLELRHAFAKLLAEFSMIELARPRDELAYAPSFHLRGLTQLPVRFT
ncbi:MAG: cytochrome P450, partial [Pseudomonadota bacterium]